MLEQFPTLHELEGHVNSLRILECVLEIDNVGMLEPRHDPLSFITKMTYFLSSTAV